ncbi:unnamed protein product [Thlaspi arvense]|uniref:Uncharacterized protein n=1 Tax=Thlaspi arvense TaxID=13288 RepID=A0AAU9RJQ6_THLAR|nr:unnamed protein product [Thlaspi arvense]
MASSASPAMHIAMANPCANSSSTASKPGTAMFRRGSKGASWAALTSSSHISSAQPLHQRFQFSSVKLQKFVAKAMSKASNSKPLSGLPIDLRGQIFPCSPFLHNNSCYLNKFCF